MWSRLCIWCRLWTNADGEAASASPNTTASRTAWSTTFNDTTDGLQSKGGCLLMVPFSLCSKTRRRRPSSLTLRVLVTLIKIELMTSPTPSTSQVETFKRSADNDTPVSKRRGHPQMLWTYFVSDSKWKASILVSLLFYTCGVFMCFISIMLV